MVNDAQKWVVRWFTGTGKLKQLGKVVVDAVSEDHAYELVMQKLDDTTGKFAYDAIRQPLVTWKDEGRTGPVKSFTGDAIPERHPVGGWPIFPLKPFLPEDVEPTPEGEVDHGWLTRAAAVKLAESMDAEFYEL